MSVESTKRYEKCLVWKSDETAAKIKELARSRDGVDLDVEHSVMFFPDKFTFDHIVYHYSVKMPPDSKPEKKMVSEFNKAT